MKKPFSTENANPEEKESSDKALRRLSRKDLLRLLIEQMEENDALRKELAVAQEQLASRKIEIEKAGSLAEASMVFSGVIEAAEKASALYLENIKRMESELKERLRETEDESSSDDQVRGRHAAL